MNKKREFYDIGSDSNEPMSEEELNKLDIDPKLKSGVILRHGDFYKVISIEEALEKGILKKN